MAYTENKFKIYSLVKDVDGNQSGSMFDGGYKITTIEIEKPDSPIIPFPGVSPEDGAEINDEVEFAFGFTAVDGELAKLELDIYLGNTGVGRDYDEHLGINLPAGSEFVERWVENVVKACDQAYDQLDEKYKILLEAAGYQEGVDDENNIETLKNNISYKGDKKVGSWIIKLDTTLLKELNVDKVEFLIAVKDNQGNQWGENNFNKPDAGVQAFLYEIK